MLAASFATISLTGVVRPVYILPLPVIFLILGVFASLFSLSRMTFVIANWPAAMLVGLIGLNLAVLYLIFPENTLMAHFFAVIFLLFVWFVYLEVLIRASDAIQVILSANMLSLYLICTLAIFAYAMMLLGFGDVFSWLGRLKPPTAHIAPGVPRLYGFASQPSQFAYFLLAFGPLALVHHKNLIRRQLLAKTTLAIPVLLISTTFLLTFSVGSYLVAAIACILTLLIKNKPLELASFFGCAVLAMLAFFFFNPEIIESLYGKISLDTSFKSAAQRVDAALAAVRAIAESPFGHGAGFLTKSTNSTAINWYLTLAAEAGLFSLSFFLGIIFFVFATIKRAPKEFQTALVFSWISISLSLNLHSTVGTSPIWPLGALIMAMSRYQDWRGILNEGA